MKAPLRAIGNLAAWIEEDLGEAMNGESREHMQLLRNRVDRLDGLLGALLDYSRVGRADEVCETVETGALVAEIVDVLDIPKSATVHINDNLPTLTTAKAPLFQVLVNLIANAVKHHDRDDMQIEVSARAYDGAVEFSVSDDGPGIAEEFHERIFGMFQKLRGRDEVEGSGIGLSLVAKQGQLHGGTVEVLSGADSRGATFRFTWSEAA